MARKKEKFIEKEKGKGLEFKPVYLLPLLVIAAGVFFVMNSAPESVEIANAEGSNDIRIPISEINDGKARFYSYESETGKIIRFFVLKSADGIFRAAFDTCDVCYKEKKGYRQEGDYMICNNCGRRFLSTRINIEQGGCNPAPLERTLEDNYLVIKRSDIEKGSFYF